MKWCDKKEDKNKWKNNNEMFKKNILISIFSLILSYFISTAQCGKMVKWDKDEGARNGKV